MPGRRESAGRSLRYGSLPIATNFPLKCDVSDLRGVIVRFHPPSSLDVRGTWGEVTQPGGGGGLAVPPVCTGTGVVPLPPFEQTERYSGASAEEASGYFEGGQPNRSLKRRAKVLGVPKPTS